MREGIVGLIVLAFKILIRYWAKDKSVLSLNIIDFIQFAEKCGMSYWEAKKFDRTLGDFVDSIAEDFIKGYGSQIRDDERKKEIILQIGKDIQEIAQSELIVVQDSSELQRLIMSKSRHERELWSEVEIGVYENCVQYISRMVLNFVSKLPDFSNAALKIVIQRQEEYNYELKKILLEIHTMNDLINSREEYHEYESLYRQKIIDRYGKIELIGSKIQNRNIRRYDITSAYVKLNCIDNVSIKEIELSSVFEVSNVVWVKGEAGAGKTTFLQWIAMCAAKGEYYEISNIEGTIPVVIELRSIEWPFNLRSVVDTITVSEGIHSPEGWIHELLKRQELILLFDGLDEISKDRRNEVYNYVEDIVKKYPQIKILLTSRNSVKDNIECLKSCYEIVPMNMGNIRLFVEYWHESVLRHDAIIDDNEIESLQYNLKRRIAENQSLKDLACNPLLCAMLCALNYVNNEQIPEDKMRLYEQCCEMLMDARDTQRNIGVDIYKNVPQFDYSTKRRILEEIAFRMLNSGVPSENRENIIGFIKQLLENTNIISDTRCGYSAESILDFFIERSGIIREPSEGQIDFVHKTFMDFLAVKTICRNNDWDVLIREACNDSWRETIVMCFREMGNESVDYALRKLVDTGRETQNDTYFLMASLCVSNAKFFYSPIKNEIDEKIKGMIPPSVGKIEEMAELGLYLLPFLRDCENHTLEEKNNCLYLLSMLKMKETIPIILTYITNVTFIQIYQFSVDLLWQYTNSELEEYNVKEQLIKVMLNSSYNGRLLICESMLYILDNYDLNDREINILKNIKEINIFCQNSETLKSKETNFGRYFESCETVQLFGEIKNLSFLGKFEYIKNMKIKSDSNFSILTYELSKLGNLASVVNLLIETNQRDFYLLDRTQKNMYNIELIELYLHNGDLSIHENTLDCFIKLKKVIFNVDKNLAYAIENAKYRLVGDNTDLEIQVVVI